MPQLSRRSFILHSAHRTIGVSAGLAVLESALRAEASPQADANRRPLELCLVSGSFEYHSDQSLAALEKYLVEKFPVRCTRAFAPSEDRLPGLENLDHADCMLLFTRRLTIQGQPLDQVKRFCQRGGAILGLRTASHAFQHWLALDKEVFGGDYQGHYGNQLLPRIEIVGSQKDHPVLAGVGPLAAGGSLYKNPALAKDVTVLLTGTIPGHTEPVAWTRLHRGGRVFYTSLGHPDDFRQPSFLKLLVNALFWATAREGARLP
jgi:type 1 glutamine amidotransferase